MRIGVPREQKDQEFRVGMVPDGVRPLVAGGARREQKQRSTEPGSQRVPVREPSHLSYASPSYGVRTATVQPSTFGIHAEATRAAILLAREDRSAHPGKGWERSVQSRGSALGATSGGAIQ